MAVGPNQTLNAYIHSEPFIGSLFLAACRRFHILNFFFFALVFVVVKVALAFGRQEGKVFFFYRNLHRRSKKHPLFSLSLSLIYN